MIIEVARIAALQSLQARADQLNEYEFYFGTPDGLARDLARFKDATPQRMQRVASSILTPAARVVRVVLPSAVSPGTSTRETRPEAAPARAFAPAAPEILDIGGVPAMLWSRPTTYGGLPLVSASRLNQNLREKTGFTYGARAAFSMAPSLGCFEARAAVQTKVTGPAITELLSEFSRIRAGDISADETQKAALSIRQDVVGDFATLDGILGQAAGRAASGLSFATIATDLTHASSITPRTLNTLAKNAITTDQGVLVLVGDKSAILKQLEALKNLPGASIVDSYGNEVK